MTWIQTYTRKRFDLLDPQPEDVDIRDIAHALAGVNRFGGHTEPYYSVASHSVAASNRVDQRYALHALLHDAPEAYIGDITRPLRELLAAGSNDLRDADYRIAVAIKRRFGLEWTDEARAAVKEVDERCLVTEARDLLGKSIDDWTAKFPEPFGGSVERHYDPKFSFLLRFLELTIAPAIFAQLWEIVKALNSQPRSAQFGCKILELLCECNPPPFAQPQPIAATEPTEPPKADLAGAVVEAPAATAPRVTQQEVRQALANSATPEPAPVDDGRPLSRLAHQIRLELFAAGLSREQNTTIRKRICEIYAAGELNSAEASYLQEIVALNHKRIDRAECASNSEATA